MTTSIYAAITVIEEANRAALYEDWRPRRLKPGSLCRGTVEHVAYVAGYGLILVIDGLYMPCSHKDLAEAVWDLKPLPGERIEVVNHGGRPAFAYTVVVDLGGGNERMWRSGGEVSLEDSDEDLDLGWLREETDAQRKEPRER